MAKQKPTKKEIETVISSIVTHLDYIDHKLSALDSLFGLYLKWKKDVDEFNKFIEKNIKQNDIKNKEKEPGEAK